MFHMIRKFGLKVKNEKLWIGRDVVEYLEYGVSAERYSLEPFVAKLKYNLLVVTDGKSLQ